MPVGLRARSRWQRGEAVSRVVIERGQQVRSILSDVHAAARAIKRHEHRCRRPAAPQNRRSSAPLPQTHPTHTCAHAPAEAVQVKVFGRQQLYAAALRHGRQLRRDGVQRVPGGRVRGGGSRAVERGGAKGLRRAQHDGARPRNTLHVHPFGRARPGAPVAKAQRALLLEPCRIAAAGAPPLRPAPTPPFSLLIRPVAPHQMLASRSVSLRSSRALPDSKSCIWAQRAGALTGVRAWRRAGSGAWRSIQPQHAACTRAGRRGVPKPAKRAASGARRPPRTLLNISPPDLLIMYREYMRDMAAAAAQPRRPVPAARRRWVGGAAGPAATAAGQQHLRCGQANRV